MSKGILTSLNFGVYPGYCVFAYRYSYDEIIAELKNQNCNEWVAGLGNDAELLSDGDYFALHRHFDYKGQEKHLYYIILKKKFKFTDQCYATLAHEVLHICQFYLPRILDRNKEHEAEAYLHTYLMVECLKYIRDAHHGQKTKDK